MRRARGRSDIKSSRLHALTAHACRRDSNNNHVNNYNGVNGHVTTTCTFSEYSNVRSACCACAMCAVQYKAWKQENLPKQRRTQTAISEDRASTRPARKHILYPLSVSARLQYSPHAVCRRNSTRFSRSVYQFKDRYPVLFVKPGCRRAVVAVYR